MKLGIVRWKITPSYNGLPCIVRPVAGFFQSFLPVARPMKFSTVFGASLGNSSHFRSPAVVWIIAVGLAAALAGAVLAVPVFVFFVPCANTILQHSTTKAM